MQVKKHSTMYKGQDDRVEVLGTAPTESECIEILRHHLLTCNQNLIDLSEKGKVPECILNLAQRSVARNPDLDITIRSDGIVFVDGHGPEMDWYTITESNNAS